jgi:hypothetical protein
MARAPCLANHTHNPQGAISYWMLRFVAKFAVPT